MQFLNPKFFSKTNLSLNQLNKTIRRNADGISYTQKNVTTISLLITILIFSLFYVSSNFFQSVINNQNTNIILPLFTNSVNEIQETNSVATPIQQNNEIKNNSINESLQQNNTAQKNKTTNTNTTKTQNISRNTSIKNEWKIVISSIGLEAQIAEGTSAEIMNKYVGHFENTNIWNGNVALAAHNRGYPVNYFANIKSLKNGDIIEYYYNGNSRRYKVEIVTVISDTDWTYLSSTNDNRITLITCVEDEPEYRRCIQGVEIKN